MSAEEVLRKIEQQATETFLPIVGRNKGRLLVSLVQKYQPKRILEIGTLVGYSAILMGQQVNNGTITCIEISPELAEAAQKNITDSGLTKRITILVGDARKIIPQLQPPFDLVFIDAAKEQYLRYLQLLEKHHLIASGTVIVADNAKIFADAMRDYLEYVRHSTNYRSEFHDFGDDGMEVSIRL